MRMRDWLALVLAMLWATTLAGAGELRPKADAQAYRHYVVEGDYSIRSA